MGRKDFMAPTWTHELFCTPKILADFDRHGIRGYKKWPVFIHKTGEVSQVISQLFISNTSNPALGEEDKLKPEYLPECGITRYAYHNRGYMHLRRGALIPNIDFQNVFEWFGSDSVGRREVIVSNRVAKLMLENRWQGFVLKPVQLF